MINGGGEGKFEGKKNGGRRSCVCFFVQEHPFGKILPNSEIALGNHKFFLE